MDEYIKKSEAVDVIVKYPYEIAGKTATAIKMIEDLPSADVVPKSEYDKAILLLEEEIARLKNSILPSYYQACSEDEAIKIGIEYGKQEAKEEIEKLNVELDAMRGAANSLKMHYEKAEAEIETLKDNNEHLAVMLEEAKAEVERLQAEKDALIKNYAECMKDYSSEIFAEIETLLALNILVGDVFTGKYFDADLENDIAELKKKYTEARKETDV